MWNRLILRLLLFLINRFKYKQRGIHICSNRYEVHIEMPLYNVSLIYTDTTKPGGYSREEVLEMLTKVRSAEFRMGWKCPEPNYLMKGV